MLPPVPETKTPAYENRQQGDVVVWIERSTGNIYLTIRSLAAWLKVNFSTIEKAIALDQNIYTTVIANPKSKGLTVLDAANIYAVMQCVRPDLVKKLRYHNRTVTQMLYNLVGYRKSSWVQKFDLEAELELIMGLDEEFDEEFLQIKRHFDIL
ncbi:MAG: hypothetical protein KME17_13480 [Cyanosarcina radialis HA8281-LM2]|jgi:hypothetical protein|nr:hypothetical protein [Cyanosarcina radialis HA8281-LM2]